MSSQVAVPQLPTWTLTDRLRKARETTGLDQTDFAKQLGVARSTIVRYERGQTKPQPALLRAWASLCEVPYGWITGEGLTRGPDGGPSIPKLLPRADSNGQPAAYLVSTQSDQSSYEVYGSSHSDELHLCDSQAA